MNNVYEWFAGLATPGNMTYFVAGFGFAFVYRWLWCKVKHRRLIIPWRYVGITVGISAIIAVSLQSSQAYTTAKNTALEQKQCSEQFNAALRARSKITTENDQLSRDQRTIVFNWIHDLIFPPPPYNAMASDDPRRQEYGLTLTINTDRVFRESINKQNALLAERDRHPLPDPKCAS